MPPPLARPYPYVLDNKCVWKFCLVDSSGDKKSQVAKSLNNQSITSDDILVKAKYNLVGSKTTRMGAGKHTINHYIPRDVQNGNGNGNHEYPHPHGITTLGGQPSFFDSMGGSNSSVSVASLSLSSSISSHTKFTFPSSSSSSSSISLTSKRFQS